MSRARKPVKQTEKEKVKLEPLDVATLLLLPDYLRKTAMVMLELEEATASEVAERTERARAVESGYLNQLERMGFLERKRRGRLVYFSTRS